MGKSLDELRPWFRPKVAAFLSRAAESGIPLRLSRTGTSDVVQAALYAIGRTELTLDQKEALLADGLYPDDFSTPRTHAQSAADTPHGSGLAFDVVVLNETGRPLTTVPQTTWQKLYLLAERCGLDALGDPWGEFVSWDKGHFQEGGWRIYKADGWSR